MYYRTVMYFDDGREGPIFDEFDDPELAKGAIIFNTMRDDFSSASAYVVESINGDEIYVGFVMKCRKIGGELHYSAPHKFNTNLTEGK